MTQEVLKLALEALEELFDTNGYWWQEVDEQTLKKIEHSITAIKEALAQEQETVAFDCCGNCLRPKHEHQGDNCPKPYTTTWNAWDYPFAPDTTPPQRSESSGKPSAWVELTNQELTDLFYNTNLGQQSAVAQAIALLKEKNT